MPPVPWVGKTSSASSRRCERSVRWHAQLQTSVVAKAMKNEVEKFRKSFKTIEFAVYCPPYDDTNYRVFKRVLETI